MEMDSVEFADRARDALNHLYDSSYLQNHPLAELLVAPSLSAPQRSKEMRSLLLNAIRTLRPPAGVPAQSADWRAYRILELRYIEGMTPGQVMDEVALGKSQYYREQSRAVEAVAAVLWDEWQDAAPSPGTETAPDEESVSPLPPERTQREQWAQQEVAHLRAGATRSQIHVGALLHELHGVVGSLAEGNRVTLHCETERAFALTDVDRALLRQAILNVLTYGIDVAHGGRLDVRCFVEQRTMGICVEAHGPVADEVTPQRQGVGLEICAELMRTMGGSLEIGPEGEAGRWHAQLVWHNPGAPTLLIVDDNAGFIELFTRYLAHTDWQVVGATGGAQARDLAATERPAVIVLDVMMPQEDGWEVLRTLQCHPEAREVPVLICSILNEPQLAETLGAADYLPKPVTQAALLRALARWHPVTATPVPAH